MEGAAPEFDKAGSSRPVKEHHGLAYRIFDRVLMLLNSIGSIWIFVLMFLICADVVARSGFNHPIDGVTDIAAFSIIGIVFLQLGATVHTGRMTKGDVLLEMLSNRSKRAGALMESLFLLVGATMFCLVIWASWTPFTASALSSSGARWLYR